MKIRNVLMASSAVLLAGWLGACGSPRFHCLAQGTVSAVGIGPFWAKYTKVDDASKPCGQLPGENIGFQEYNKPNSETFSLSYRIDGIGARLGVQDSTELEANALDPSANGSASTFTPFPDPSGICTASGFVAADQHFIAGTLDDGGTDPDLPATHITYNFTKLRFADTTNSPGTAFDGELDFTQDDCTAHYTVFGYWPGVTGCTADIDCSPIIDADAGHFSPSGINPTFAPAGKPILCNLAAGGVCELQLTSVDEIVKLQ